MIEPSRLAASSPYLHGNPSSVRPSPHAPWPAPKYDSVERRDADANNLEARGIDREAVSAKMGADVRNAKPATGAKPARSAEMLAHRSELGR